MLSGTRSGHPPTMALMMSWDEPGVPTHPLTLAQLHLILGMTPPRGTIQQAAFSPPTVDSRLHDHRSLTPRPPPRLLRHTPQSRRRPIPRELPPLVVADDLNLVYDDVALENQQPPRQLLVPDLQRWVPGQKDIRDLPGE
jgi:hypothetical protein